MLEPISSNRRVIKTRPSTAGSSRRRYHNIRGTCRSGPSIFVDHTIERKHDDDDDDPYPIRKKRPSTASRTRVRYYKQNRSGRPATAPRPRRKKKKRKKKRKPPPPTPPKRPPSRSILGLVHLGGEASFALGLVHERRRSLFTAQQYYRIAAQHQHPRAQFHLGLLLAKEDSIASLSYLLKSSQQESTIQSKAMVAVGDHFTEIGDTIQGCNFYKLASELNYAVGQLRYANCFLKGFGTCKKSISKAIELLKLADLQEQNEAQYILGKLYSQGKGNVNTFRGDIIAVHYWKRSATNGYAPAQWILAKSELNGFGGLLRNEVLAASLFLKAANQGLARAQNSIATCYYQGKGVLQNFKKAAFYYNKAKEQRHTDAAENLDRMREQGLDVPIHFPVRLRNYKLKLKP